jgi:chemotaxis methyl-accepting protein methylase
MSHTKYRNELAEDMRGLRRLLEKTVPAAGRTGLTAAGEIAILDVACGGCDEAATLSEFFSCLRASGADAPTSTLLVGTDVRARELDEARERFFASPGRQFEFIAGDASKLDRHRQLREKFDIVFFRHQNLYNGRSLWRRVFEQGLSRLDDDGLLIITSYFDREHELAIKAFSDLGARLVSNERNSASRLLATPGKSVDRHLAIFRQAPPES